MKAIDRIGEVYITESELAELLNVDLKRVRDLRSNHITGKIKFINHIKPTSKCILYPLEEVLVYLESCKIRSFGVSSNPDEDDSI